ncbi:hypothetical protein EV586_102230 [Tumebacillus sp. BK434]|uniref:hypothetical protein n=1 Tax=Tumebacillus sp. BK434 TaxID=2512169 RepID=UPI0010438C8E|nr:hypothetical protein [Tumebacillus sp. BK434]TCP57786.1 hypothetical protein EV586_102230 [Tumebacillus sp. BK434]
MVKLIFIENPHDVRSRELRVRLAELGLTDETHFVSFQDVTCLPIQAAPCVFLVGVDDLLDSFTEKDVVDHLNFVKNKTTTEERLNYLGQLAVRARLAGVK